MIKIQNKKINIEKIIIIILLLLILMLIVLPEIAISSFLNGIMIWATKVLPSLLPFLILTKLLSYTSFISNVGNKLSPITQKLYNVGGVSGYIYFMSIVSGYPIGAKLTSDFYNNNTITKGQAEVITSFTSTSGPLFIIGSVAIGMFQNKKLGYIILISHYLSAILNGLIYRKKFDGKISTQSYERNINPLSNSMSESITSILSIGGFIAIFYMILQILLSINFFTIISYPLNLIGIDTMLTNSILSGIIEVTSGCIMLSNLAIPFNSLSIILSFLISFGGISIHAQAYSFLKNFNMSYSKFLLQKTTQSIISSVITFIIVLIF